MSYQKIKKEEYKNIGGINQKASVYITGEREVLNLVNYDFQVPGAWNKRWGYTNAIAGNALSIGASTVTYYINQGFLKNLSGLSAQIVTTAVTSRGFFSLTGANLTSYATFGFWNLPLVTTAIVNPFIDLGNGNAVNFYLGASSGQINMQTIFSSYPYVLKRLNSGTLSLYSSSRAAPNVTIGSTGSGSGLSGIYYFLFTFQNNFGYESTWGGDVGVVFNTYQLSVTGQYPYFSYAAGTSSIISQLGGDIYGVSYINVYRTATASATVPTSADQFYFNQQFSYPLLATLNTITATSVSTDSPLFTDDPDRYQSNEIGGNGISVFQGNWLENYQSRLWIFRSLELGKCEGNTLKFTEPLEETKDIELLPVENKIIVGSGKFSASGIKAFNQRLMLFTTNEVYALTGDNASNFNLQNLSNEYGCVNGNSIVVFEDRMWFLDQFKIVEYNGASLQDVSQRVAPILDRMNVEAAKKYATAIHWPDRNEVWFSFPVDGSTVNNMTLIYQYEVNAWTNFSGFNPGSLNEIYRGITASSTSPSPNEPLDKRLYHSAIGGSLHYFGTEFANDNGQGITLTYKTRFHNEQGESSTALWRRYFQDNGAYGGSSLAFAVRTYSNYATAAVSYTATMYFNGSQYSGQQQTRIDFGIPAKALSFEVVHGSTAGNLTVHGYTVERRYLRDV